MQLAITRIRKNARLHTGSTPLCLHEDLKTVNKLQNEFAKCVVEHEHEHVAIRNGMDTKFDAAGKDMAIRDYNLFSGDIENGQRCAERELEMCVIKQVRKPVVTGVGTDSNVDAADSDATVAGPAAIQFTVAKLRLGERAGNWHL